MTKERNRMLDVIRGVLILIVVLGHAIQVSHGGEDNPIHEFIRSFQMELFFVLSGIVAAFAAQKPVWMRIRSYFQRLGVPYVSWAVLLFVVQCCFGTQTFAVRALASALAFSWFWFFRILLVILLLKELFIWLKPRIGVWMTVGILTGLCFVLSRIPGLAGSAHYSIFLLSVIFCRRLPIRIGLKMSAGRLGCLNGSDGIHSVFTPFIGIFSSLS